MIVAGKALRSAWLEELDSQSPRRRGLSCCTSSLRQDKPLPQESKPHYLPERQHRASQQMRPRRPCFHASQTELKICVAAVWVNRSLRTALTIECRMKCFRAAGCSPHISAKWRRPTNPTRNFLSMQTYSSITVPRALAFCKSLASRDVCLFCERKREAGVIAALTVPTAL